MVGAKPCHMFSSRLYPLFVRAVSFQTCDRTSVQLLSSAWFTPFMMVNSGRAFITPFFQDDLSKCC
ncbi:hypothetical protein C7R93_04985 [Brevibacillus fortis]|uniref:Uncharacterized protein n=1 Tax=Brevibacillus fortis TaxID=2126352 RepID=A0A2P7VJ35_9BACL|nr:hypothetical protein C7R93_04985 [Brevibacillus fortis]